MSFVPEQSTTCLGEGAGRSFADVWRDVQDVDGWLTESQGRMLYEAARNVASGETIVEIGSHHGRSTLIMCAAKPHDASLAAVDPFGDPYWGGGEDSLEIFRFNVANHGVTDVNHVRELGADAGRSWDGGRVGVLFVDGAHDYPSVAADLEAWLPHLSPTATVLMHDAYSSPGVTRAAFVRMFGAQDFTFVGSSRSLVGFERCTPSLAGRMWSGLRMLVKLPWFARNVMVKIAYRQGWRAVPTLLGHRGQPFPY